MGFTFHVLSEPDQNGVCWADHDDPKMAEVISKVLLLARDAELKDPTIMEQIRGRS